MSRRRKLVITWDENGAQYIRVKDSGIRLLFAMHDGLTLVLFGKEKEPHMRLADALEWHRNELPCTRGKKRELTETLIARMTEQLARKAPDDMRTA